MKKITSYKNDENSCTPKISIIVPTYNRTSVISRAINSIKKQTFNKWECIIVDDHSTDNTSEVISHMIENDKRFSFIENTRSKGAPGARNTGVLAAHGKYIVLFDSDNVMHPDFLEKVYTKLQDDNVNICGAFSSIISESTGLQIGTFTWEGYGHIHQAILRGKSYFDNSSTLIERAKLIEIGLLDEKCPSFQEWDTHIRLSKKASYSTVKEELIDYYRGGDDTISKSKERAILGQIYIMNKFKSEFINVVPSKYLRKNVLILSLIKSISDKECYERLLHLFEKDKSKFFLAILKVLYYVKLTKNLL